MTWLQIKIWMIRYRILVAACAIAVAMLAWELAARQNRLVIETHLPEEDFVVVCNWNSELINLHGGADKVREKILVGKSNTELACGWWLLGDLSVEILHPAYRTVLGCDRIELCAGSHFHFEDQTMFFEPVGFGEFIDSLQGVYDGEDLLEKISLHVGVHFSGYYFNKFRKARVPDIERLMDLYNGRLLAILRPIYDRYDLGSGAGSPESVVNAFWNYGRDIK